MTRRLAVLSDVHGNLVALRAVLADQDALGIGEIVLAGDMVGLGPEPDGVVDLLRERGAAMIQGNHEQDYVARYGTPRMPATWRASSRSASMRWLMERLGPERREFLANLPKRLLIDESTLVVHGSARHIRDSVTASETDAELEAMFVGESARLVFTGHTHEPVIRDLPTRRLVNVGSVGLPLDGDPRAAYVIASRDDTGIWSVRLRRVDFDVEAALAAYDDQLRAQDWGFVELMSRSMRAARDVFGAWMVMGRDLPDDQIDTALSHYLAEHP